MKMHNWKLWVGIALILVALLPSIGFTLGVIPVLTGPLLVVVAILGGYLLGIRKHR